MQQAKKIASDCQIETDLEILIPDSYVSNVSERLQLYARLDNLEGEQELQEFAAGLRDRFGSLPVSVEELIDSVRLRWIGKSLGFERIIIKQERMKGYFISEESYFKSEVFEKVLAFVSANPNLARLKDSAGQAMIIFSQIKSVSAARLLLSGLV